MQQLLILQIVTLVQLCIIIFLVYQYQNKRKPKIIKECKVCEENWNKTHHVPKEELTFKFDERKIETIRYQKHYSKIELNYQKRVNGLTNEILEQQGFIEMAREIYKYKMFDVISYEDEKQLTFDYQIIIAIPPTKPTH